MSAGSILRALTPLGWLAAAAAALALGCVLLGGLGFRWDPLNLQHKRLDAAALRRGMRLPWRRRRPTPDASKPKARRLRPSASTTITT